MKNSKIEIALTTIHREKSLVKKKATFLRDEKSSNNLIRNKNSIKHIIKSKGKIFYERKVSRESLKKQKMDGPEDCIQVHLLNKKFKVTDHSLQEVLDTQQKGPVGIKPLTSSCRMKTVDGLLFEALTEKPIAEKYPSQLMFWVHDIVSQSACTRKHTDKEIAAYISQKEIHSKKKESIDPEQVKEVLRWLNGEHNTKLDKQYLKETDKDEESVTSKTSVGTQWG